jgi:hypothetical protein
VYGFLSSCVLCIHRLYIVKELINQHTALLQDIDRLGACGDHVVELLNAGVVLINQALREHDLGFVDETELAGEHFENFGEDESLDENLVGGDEIAAECWWRHVVRKVFQVEWAMRGGSM